jgi:hypothetical protein
MRRGVARVLAAALMAAAVAAAVAVSGCTDDGDPSPSGSPAPELEQIDFAIADGRAEPPLERVTVARGTTVRITVTSDQPDELHLHGYDLTAELVPGQAGVIEFVADQAGLFELETHESALVLLQLQVQ